MENNTVKSFVSQVLAQISGDKDEVLAQRNYRTANAAVKGQISTLEASQVNAETSLEQAQDAMLSAKYPTSPIGDTSAYIRNIASKEALVSAAQETLDQVNESIEYFRGIYDEFNPKS